MRSAFLCIPLLLVPLAGPARAQDLAATVDERVRALEGKVIEWRRHVHQHPELSNRETNTAQLVADHLRKLGMEVKRVMVAEDFSYFQQEVPGLFYFVGITPRDQDMLQAAPNHSPRFSIDESGLLQGTRSLAALAVDFLGQKP